MSRKGHPGSKGMGFWSATSIGVGATLFTTYSVSNLAIRFPSKAGVGKSELLIVGTKVLLIMAVILYSFVYQYINQKLRTYNL